MSTAKSDLGQMLDQNSGARLFKPTLNHFLGLSLYISHLLEIGKPRIVLYLKFFEHGLLMMLIYSCLNVFQKNSVSKSRNAAKNVKCSRRTILQ